MNFILIWIIIFALVVISFFTKSISLWIPIILYVVAVFVRAKETIGNYFDAEKRSTRDEKLQLNEKAEEMAGKGLVFSGFRVQEEKRIKDDFEFERKTKKRKLWVDLVNTLFLK